MFPDDEENRVPVGTALRKEGEHMRGPMMIFAAAVFLLLIVAYLAHCKRSGERIGGKMHDMLLLGLMRLDIAAAQGLHYVRLTIASVCRSYHPAGMESSIAHKRERMENYRRSMGETEDVRRRHYNRKILE